MNLGRTDFNSTWLKSPAMITTASGLAFIWLLIKQYSYSSASLALVRGGMKAAMIVTEPSSHTSLNGLQLTARYSKSGEQKILIVFAAVHK